MTTSRSEKVARRFVDAINRHQVDELVGLTSLNHVFVDSLGQRVEGRARLRQAWTEYFRMVPDYAVSVHEVLARGASVILVGTAEGTYTADGRLLASHRWHTPAAWRAVVRNGKIAEWQVYADNEPIRAILRRTRK